MLRVKNRRRLAITILVTFALVSGFVTLTALDEYAPSDLKERAEKYIASATPYELRIENPSVSLGGCVTFEKAEVLSGESVLVSANMVTVRGLPKPLGNWRPSAVEAQRISVAGDVCEPVFLMDSAKALSELVELGAALECSLPPQIHVTLTENKADARRFLAPSDDFVESRVLKLKPVDVPDLLDWDFRMSSDEVRLFSMWGTYDDPFAKRIAAEWEAVLLGRDDVEFRGGDWDVTWTRTGRTTSCAYCPDGLVVPDTAERFGVDIGEDSLEVKIVSARTTDGDVIDLEVDVEYGAALMTRERLSALAALVGFEGATGPEDPDTYENVRIEGLFFLENSALRYHYRESQPFAWSEVDGEVIPLVSGKTEISLAEFLNRLEAVRESFAADAADTEEDSVEVEEDGPTDEPEGI